ncbi:MAG: 2-succinylbenzoate--CoA ligase [Waterburya sp.]
MNYEPFSNLKNLRKYLKSSTTPNWLWCYEPDCNQEVNDYPNRRLEQLIDARLEEVSSLVELCSQQSKKKTAIFIVETEPINFITAFLVGVISEVNLFLCDPGWQTQEWQQVLSLVQPDLIFGDDTVKSLIQSAIAKGVAEPIAKHPQREIPGLKSTPQNTPDLITNVELAEQPLIMIPTGGTSGKIKFAIHSWQTLTASVKGFADFFNCPQLNSVCTLPLYHVSGLMQLMRSLLTQGNLVICPYQLIATKLSNLDKSAYFISLVPTQLQFLLASTPNCLEGFKTVLVGGAPPRRSLLQTAREYRIPLALTYGMTETASGVVTLKSEDFLAGNYSSGEVLPHAQVKIAHEQLTSGTEELTLEDRKYLTSRKNPPTDSVSDHTGLIQINSAALCLGYYPQLFPASKSLLTDDVGYFDGQGYLHLLGRNSQKIITGGENVFPAEVEAVIYATKLVQDICVVGIPDQKWGQAVTAIYVPLTAANNLNLIKQQIKSQLAKYKQPKHWLSVASIPRNDRGKVNYPQLKAIALQIVNDVK